MRKAIDRNAGFPASICDQSQAKQIDLQESGWEQIRCAPSCTPEDGDQWRLAREKSIRGKSPIVLKAWTMEETGWAYRDENGIIADPNFRHFASLDSDILFGKSGKVFVDIYQQK